MPLHSILAAKKSKGPPPAISHLLPSGGKAGSTFSCTIGGELAKSENQVWTDHPGLMFHPTAKPVVFDVTISPEVPPGPHLVRFYNEDGAAPPHVFVVGKYDEVAEVEPNDDFHKPQRLAKIPVTVNGVLEKSGSADTFAFEAQAGKWIVLDLQGYALGSQMDPAMRLLDEHGVEVAMSHDTYNLDPLIAYEAKKSGTYIVQV
ncbi:MAG TPA: PPC domain-containing protein, partial [Verrucomicrobiaceae bacterium]